MSKILYIMILNQTHSNSLDIKLASLTAGGEPEVRAGLVKVTPHPHAGLGTQQGTQSRQTHRKLPRHIQKLKAQAEQRNKKSGLEQSLPTLHRDVEKNKSTEIVHNYYSESFSESSETESQQDSGMDFVGFKKTRDFGDFVTFSNSPHQV